MPDATVQSMAKTPFTMRLDDDLKAKLKTLADKEKRPLTNYMEYLLWMGATWAEKDMQAREATRSF